MRFTKGIFVLLILSLYICKPYMKNKAKQAKRRKVRRNSLKVTGNILHLTI
ncbi:hypothetical protein NEPAR06_2224 [Nematocida parisii]|uniref:Uncharacterized protein n=1 Tax=Nematocida parisii (strain ERTm3) TaxID=935791 RepID=I3EKK7_NEMP3|nr:uncharacterized protein NEPG_00708 [Nematocida parisii ERTm1]EIJ89754.1 hypothetical protein NEQG_00524 [Nematocida parisii ERTm3]KAI5146152.1 hypothetical protein NEPAR07_2151 [Nematocida parisii]EIJ94043.1 hypothetical protein NEPG_00708 [Nematocida parisii ERTm1]KAI5156621.1 hypothetical protein NEPAR06_2224 [Nematocida parisii]KAI5158905.1 hypothetical protein NEPAR05_2252 [Nematocida parisii]|eukprot:XP_013058539.1 hypothetical protein NEPG_00708 [Nematocida parisii ERTm1]